MVGFVSIFRLLPVLLFFLKGDRGDRARFFVWTPALGEIGMGDSRAAGQPNCHLQSFSQCIASVPTEQGLLCVVW